MTRSGPRSPPRPTAEPQYPTLPNRKKSFLSRCASCNSPHFFASTAASSHEGFWSGRRGSGALRSIVAIERNSRSRSACAGNRPALSARSRVPCFRSRLAAPVGAQPWRSGQFVGRIAAQRDEIRDLARDRPHSDPGPRLGRCAPFRQRARERELWCCRRQAGTCRGRRSRRAPCRHAFLRQRQPPQENRRPRTRPLWHSRSRMPRRTPAGVGSCSSRSSSNFAPALVGRELLVPICWDFQRIPRDEHRARPFRRIEHEARNSQSREWRRPGCEPVRMIVFGSAW